MWIISCQSPRANGTMLQTIHFTAKMQSNEMLHPTATNPIPPSCQRLSPTFVMFGVVLKATSLAHPVSSICFITSGDCLNMDSVKSGKKMGWRYAGGRLER